LPGYLIDGDFMNGLEKLVVAANSLDSLGFVKEADSLDNIIRKIAGELLDDSDLHEEFKGIPVQDPDYPEEEVDEYGSDEEVDEVEPDIKEKHFGFSLDGIGEKIGKVLKLCNPNDLFYNKDPIHEVLIRTVGDPNFKYLGAGSFRMVFSYGNDYVIKIAVPGGWFNHSIKMNKEDAAFGRMPKYSDLFPKVYETDPAYKWIIMERCSVINDENKFLEFFPNPVTDPFVTNPFARIELFAYALRSCVYKETKSEAEIAGHTDYLVNQLKDKMGIRPEEIIRAYERLTLFNKIVDFCKEFGALPREIRIGNVGISSDGRFVIIDSSVEETITNIFK
jgi:hypothetical protein